MISKALLVALGFLATSASAEPDELCAQLRQFEQRAASTAEPQWIEVYWYYDPTAIFSVACKHQKAGVGKDLCSWLPGRMSSEFPGILPKRISACYGLSPDRFGPQRFPSKTIKFRSASGEYFLMQTGKLEPGNLPWLRLIFFGRTHPSAKAFSPPAPFKSSSP